VVTGTDPEMVLAGAEIIVNINASPYFAGRLREREEVMQLVPSRIRSRSSTSTSWEGRTSSCSTERRW
jgi:hypothetical protein